MNYTEKIVKGSAIGFLMIVIGTGVGYLIRLYLSRALTVEEFGLFYGILAFTSIFSVLCEIGLKEGLVKYLPEFRVKGDRNRVKSLIYYVLAFHIILASVLIIVFYFMSDYIAVTYFHNAGASVVMKILGISGALFIFIRDASSIFSGLGRLKLLSYVSPFNNIMFMISIIIVGASLSSISYAYMTSVIITIAAFYFIIFRMPYFSEGKFISDKAMLRQLIFFSIPVFLISFLDTMTSYMDTLMLTFFRSLEEVGYYQVAWPTSRLLLVFYSAIILVIFPVFSELWAKKDKKGLSNVLSMALKYMLIFILPFVMLTVAFPEEIIRMLFGIKYLPASPALQILSFSAAFLTLSSILGTLFVAIGKWKTYGKVMIIVFLVNLGLNIGLVPYFGIIGAAISTTVSLFLSFSIYLYFVKKEIKINFHMTDFFKIVALSFLVLITITLIKNGLDTNPWIEMTISLSAGMVVYLFSLIYSRTIAKRDLDMLNRANIWIPHWIKNLLYKVVKD